MTLVKSGRIKQSKGALDAVLHGRVIAIDPASGAASNPGYCIMEAGVVQEYGILRVPSSRAINGRLKAIHETIRDELPEADILVIEDIPLFFLKKFCYDVIANAVGVPIRANYCLSEGPA